MKGGERPSASAGRFAAKEVWTVSHRTAMRRRAACRESAPRDEYFSRPRRARSSRWIAAPNRRRIAAPAEIGCQIVAEIMTSMPSVQEDQIGNSNRSNSRRGMRRHSRWRRQSGQRPTSETGKPRRMAHSGRAVPSPAMPPAAAAKSTTSRAHSTPARAVAGEDARISSSERQQGSSGIISRDRRRSRRSWLRHSLIR